MREENAGKFAPHMQMKDFPPPSFLRRVNHSVQLRGDTIDHCQDRFLTLPKKTLRDEKFNFFLD